MPSQVRTICTSCGKPIDGQSMNQHPGPGPMHPDCWEDETSESIDLDSTLDAAFRSSDGVDFETRLKMIGAKVSGVLEGSEMTKAELANNMSKSVGYINRVLEGNMETLTLQDICKFEELLNVELVTIMGAWRNW